LAIKAAKLLQVRYQVKLGAEIGIKKIIPIGRGLGGGSSDAATVLLVLNHLWGLELPRPILMDLALSLGADVPFFIFGKSAMAYGIGEDLKEVQSCAKSWYLVLIPPCAVSTKDAFAWWDEENLTKPRKRKTIMPFLKNDLQEVVCAHVHEIKIHLEWLGQGGQMTGSGSALFKAFTQKEEALASARLLPRKASWVVVQALEQHPLYDFWGVAKR
jgi:4-diphosphocytidyl-2-C-methyl-D-erythritol kinase